MHGACDDGFSGRRTVTPYLASLKAWRYSRCHTTPAKHLGQHWREPARRGECPVICDDGSRGGLGAKGEEGVL